MNRLMISALLVTTVACGDDSSPTDTGADSAMADSGVDDATVDTGAAPDAGPPPEVEVSYRDGTVIGRTIDGVHSFLALPYAAPPVDDLRWKPPGAVTPWTEARDASEIGSACPQINVLAGRTTPSGEEDCLFLNVFTPSLTPAEPMPVFVWFHGGAFIFGSGGRGAGHLAQVSETVIVTLNYRLDQLGFMAHPALTAEDGTSSGNYGLMDQRAAMQWVRDNIAAFGGDPGAVTIAGESAGGISATMHGVSPGSAGLFHRAVVESGPPTLFPDLPDLTEAEALGTAVGARTGCDDPPTALSCLRALPVDELLVPADIVSQPGGIFYQGVMPVTTPIVDGVVIPEPLDEAYAAGRFETVPWLIGSNGDEGTLFHSELASTLVANEAEYDAALERAFPGEGASIEARYPVASYDDANEALTAVTSDYFNCHTRHFARRLADGGATTYLYAFEAEPQGTIPESLNLRSFHAAELVYLFDLDDFTLGSPRDDERDLVDAMQRYWMRFTATGDPNGATDPTWPEYETATDEHMLLVSPPVSGDAYSTAACDFWDGVGGG